MLVYLPTDHARRPVVAGVFGYKTCQSIHMCTFHVRCFCIVCYLVIMFCVYKCQHVLNFAADFSHHAVFNHMHN